jgi:hypothetical protein
VKWGKAPLDFRLTRSGSTTGWGQLKSCGQLILPRAWKRSIGGCGKLVKKNSYANHKILCSRCRKRLPIVVGMLTDAASSRCGKCVRARMKIGAGKFREPSRLRRDRRAGARQSTVTAENSPVAPARSNSIALCRTGFSLARPAQLHCRANSCAAASNYDRNFRTACKIEMAPGEIARSHGAGMCRGKQHLGIDMNRSALEKFIMRSHGESSN